MTQDDFKLTSLSHGAGCGCKLNPRQLAEALRCLPAVCDPNVLVGLATSDDAAVYRITDDIAVVLTVDFFTPIVDDAYEFGRIAVTNALSDVLRHRRDPGHWLEFGGVSRQDSPSGQASRNTARWGGPGRGGGGQHRGWPLDRRSGAQGTASWPWVL